MSTLYFLGDVWLPQPYKSMLSLDGMYIMNLENPITNSCKPAPNKINLKAEKNYIVDTFGKPPIAVCLANNHIMDFGEQGLIDTKRSLDELGVKHFGCGTFSDNCLNPTYIKVDGQKIALIGYVCPSTNALFIVDDSSGVMQVNPDKIKADILTAKKNNADKIIISIHWGAEEVYRPKPNDIKIARLAVDVGADLVVGHHSHCIQPFEVYKGKHIFYGLGNCIMPDINCGCQYNEEGLPSSNFVKVQRIWNKKSIIVNFNISSNTISSSIIYFNNGILEETKCNTDNFILRNHSMEKHAMLFRRSLVYWRLKSALSNYIMSPKLPSIRHIKGLITILNTKDN